MEKNANMKVMNSIHRKKMRQESNIVVMMKQQAQTHHHHLIIMEEKIVQVHLEVFLKMIMNKNKR